MLGMPPQIQYARTTDGVSIAYWTLGSGPPLVYVPDGSTSHAELIWQIPPARAWLEALGARRTLVWYDCRGTGLSDREVEDFSAEAMVRDLDAVVSRLGLERFAVFSLAQLGPVAMQYAAEHSEAVSHLLLWMCTPRSVDWMSAPQARALQQLTGDDWTVFTETAARFAVGWAQEETARKLAQVMRETVAPAVLGRMLEVVSTYDATDLLPEIRVPTLVMHRREFQWYGVDHARRLAASIPNARLTTFEGSAGAPWLESADAVLAAIDEFAPTPSASPRDARPPDHPSTGTAIILFTDIADSTVLTERLGDAAFRGKARSLDDALRSAIRDAGGSAIEGKLLGDGVLATFPGAAQAIEVARRCAAAGIENGLPLHIGLHAGDIISEGANVYGGAVNIASRICGLCDPGEILVSQTVRDLARTSAGATFEDRGEHELKGIADPVRVFAVRADLP
jgi:class 3 adenylate cyclase/pimeloyl-ACP methyl ester carboxylesterase